MSHDSCLTTSGHSLNTQEMRLRYGTVGGLGWCVPALCPVSAGPAAGQPARTIFYRMPVSRVVPRRCVYGHGVARSGSARTAVYTSVGEVG
jgi:hypothetical protein